MSDYKVKVVVTENKLPSIDIETRINDFQSVFSVVASRYYSNKFHESNDIKMNDMEAE